MKAIDPFCGAGGLTLGLRRAGWDVVAGLDADGAAATTHGPNNPETQFLAADVQAVEAETLRDFVPDVPRRERLLAGCAPCQPFSEQRRRRGLRQRSDAALLDEFGRLVRAPRPGAVLMENVPGIAATPNSGPLRRFLKTLADLGYSWDAGVDARGFGVPQHRRRYALLAAAKGRARQPEARGADASVRTAIERFPRIEAGETHAGIPNHSAANLAPANLVRVRATPPDGGSRRDWPERLGLPRRRSIGTGCSDVHGRMWWDRVAPTLTSRRNRLSDGRFGHPQQDRAISLREAAALQTFPDDYEFFGTQREIARWIGNAVPPAFATALGRTALAAAARGSAT